MSSTSHITHVRSAIAELGPLEAFHTLIEENNGLIMGSELNNGGDISEARCAIYHGLMEDWAREQQERFGYSQPFAVVALGGTGRDEMTPCSDTDYAFLFNETLEGNKFLLDLQGQVIQSNQFRDRCGFGGEVLPFNLEAIPELKDKQLNAFLDMKPVYDPEGLAGEFRSQIQDTFDPFEHFLHVSREWRKNWGTAASKNEQLDEYDIKKDGLRVFLAGIWTLAGKEFCHSQDIYKQLSDPRDLESYHFLLRIRSFIHLKKGTHCRPTALGYHDEDVLGFDDFMSFGNLAGKDADKKEKFDFANEVSSLFLSHRRRVGQFTWGVIGKELKEGRVIRPGSGIVFGTGGLIDTASDRDTDLKKSRAALATLVASQRYGIPIDPAGMETTFREAGDWLVPVPEISELFYEAGGSLADSMKFLAQVSGSLGRLFPGYAKFEVSIDERVMEQQKCLRGALLREKLRALERDVEVGKIQLKEKGDREKLEHTDFQFANSVEAALLDDDHLAAIRLALFTKRLPETPDDIITRANEDLEMHQRFSSGFSGVPLDEYYLGYFVKCGFSLEALEITKFLVENRRVFKEIALKDLMNETQVEHIVKLCNSDESLVRALYVFTYADRTDWEGIEACPDRWFNIRELYAKSAIALDSQINDPTAALRNSGISRDDMNTLRDFGGDFFGGIYSSYAFSFGPHLLQLKEDPSLPPKVRRLRIGSSQIIGIAAVDHKGIAASISGAFWKMGVEISQAHLFSAATHGLALDFFHLAAVESDVKQTGLGEITEEVAAAISAKKYISADDEANLPDIAKNITIKETAGGLFQLRAETKDEVGALIYYLTCKAHRRLGSNVYGLAAHTGKDSARVSVYLNRPSGMDLATAQEIVRNWDV